MRGDRAGFTLIELLVVIAIVAILAALIFPVIVTAQENARTSRCMANFGNIARALTLYRDENNGRNCSIWQNAWRSGGCNDKGNFFHVVAKYAGQTVEYDSSSVTGGPAGSSNATRNLIYKCPTAPWLKGEWTNGIGGHANKGWAYSMNETGWSRGKFPAGGLKDSEFRHPTQMIFVAEEMGWNSCGVGYGSGTVMDNEHPKGGNTSGDGWTSGYPSIYEDIPLSVPDHIGPHGGSLSKIYNLRVSHHSGCVCMFYDGHVKLLKTTKGYNWSILY